jgi:hypothetical protein
MMRVAGSVFPGCWVEPQMEQAVFQAVFLPHEVWDGVEHFSFECWRKGL